MSSTGSDSGTTARKPGNPKRRLTEDRKRQNREAQRRFRERRRANETTDSDAANNASINELRSSAEADFGDLTLYDAATGQVPNTSLFDYQYTSGLFLDPSILLDPGADFSSTGFSNSSSGSGSWQSSFANQTRQNLAVPSPYLNYIQIQKLNFYAARIQNAVHIGVPQKLAEVEQTLSPWYWETQFALLVLSSPPSQQAPSQVLRSPPTVKNGVLFPARFGHFPQPLRPQKCFNLNHKINSDLSPTDLQRNTPHALYIDMIPFPIFRDRIITMLAMDPPAFDEDELRRDIEEDGLLVWGAGVGGSGEKVVRDKRNWECSRDFYQKWKLLVRGSGLDEQSRWWRRMRGEDDESDDE